jgi:hypothetical protein
MSLVTPAGLVTARFPITAIGNLTIAGTTPTLVTGMTDIPPAGTYLVIFTGMCNVSSSSYYVAFGVFQGGVGIAASSISASYNAYQMPVCCSIIATVNGIQALEIRWWTTNMAATGYLYGTRTMRLIKVL